MDENKREKLRLLGYQIRPCCGLCIHSDFQPGAEWGTCKIIEYQHRKHTQTDRQLSIYKAGVCSEVELDLMMEKGLAGFAEFIK